MLGIFLFSLCQFACEKALFSWSKIGGKQEGLEKRKSEADPELDDKRKIGRMDCFYRSHGLIKNEQQERH